jgi:putative membrane protein
MDDHGDTALQSVLVAVPLLAAALAYLTAAVAVNRRRGRWPARHVACWIAGLAAVTAALVGPVATAADHDFTAHMAGHLLLGMAAPLLLVLAAPVTLALRALPAGHARVLSHLLRTGPVRILTHPVVAAALNAGGLWALYTTGLYPASARHPWLHVLVHAHVFAAGYLSTAAFIGLDPTPHRPDRGVRTAALLGFLAAHGILAKYLYAHPPTGVPAAQGHAGAELMYYGGDVIEVLLAAALLAGWYARGGRQLAHARRRGS